MNFFSRFFSTKKPLGLVIAEDQVLLAELQRDKKDGPVLKSVRREPLPEGTLRAQSIENEDVLLKALNRLKGFYENEECYVALPTSSSYTDVLRFPAKMDEKLIRAALPGELKKRLPVPLKDLNYEVSLLRQKEEVFVFFAGIECSLLFQYENLFKRAGWKPKFVLEHLALISAIPARLDLVSSLMFVHHFGEHALIVSVHEKQVFDGYWSQSNLAADLEKSLEAFVEQVGVMPSHLILSGDMGALQFLSDWQKKHDNLEFVPATFKIEGKNVDADNPYLPLATGLALTGHTYTIKHSPALMPVLK